MNEDEIIAPYISQHNDIEKRKNISLLIMAISMIKEKKVPHKFRGETL